MANPTDNADVYLKESNTTNKIKHKNNQQTHIIPTNTKPQSFISDYHIEFKIQNSILSQHKKPNEQWLVERLKVHTNALERNKRRENEKRGEQ